MLKVLYLGCIHLYCHYFGIPQTHFLEVFHRNDSGWYQNIATQGYDHISSLSDLGDTSVLPWKQSNWAFFPVYPYTIAALMKTGLDYYWSAFLVSIIFSIACFVALYQFFVQYLKSAPKAYWLTLLFIASPFSYHLSMYYTESYFLLTLLLAFVGVLQQKWWLTAIASAVLVLVRPNGIICLLPVWLFQWEQNGGGLKTLNLTQIWKNSWMFLPAALTFSAYLLYQHQATGYYNAFSLAQKGWGKQTMIPFKALFRQGDFASTFNSIYVCVVMLYALIIAKKLPLSMNVLIWINILLPLSAGSVTSMTRYISVIFPLYIVWASFGAQKAGTKYATITLCLLLQCVLLAYWAQSDPLSY